jgi:hypothetical protein
LGFDLIDFVGAVSLGSLGFAAVVGGVQVSFGATSVVVEGVTLQELQDSDNFLF